MCAKDHGVGSLNLKRMTRKLLDDKLLAQSDLFIHGLGWACSWERTGEGGEEASRLNALTNACVCSRSQLLCRNYNNSSWH